MTFVHMIAMQQSKAAADLVGPRGTQSTLPAPALAPQDDSNWLVQALGVTPVTNAPIQQYQRDVFRLWSEPYHSKYGYAPSEDYLQKEANMLASMPYLSETPSTWDAASWAVFMDERLVHFDFRYSPRDWDSGVNFVLGDVRTVTRKDLGRNMVCRVTTAHTSSWPYNVAQEAKWQVISEVPATFAANTAYPATGACYAPDPSTGVIKWWIAKTAFTSGASFNAADWNEFCPAYMLAFSLSHRGFTDNLYPATWQNNQEWWLKNPECQRWVLIWMRQFCDIFNYARWTILRKAVAVHFYEHKTGIVTVSDSEKAPQPWAPGIGTNVVPPLQLLLQLRHWRFYSHAFPDIGNTPYWANSLGTAVLQTKLGHYDIFGNAAGDIDQLANAYLGISSRPVYTQMQFGYSHINWANLGDSEDTPFRDIDPVTNKITWKQRFKELVDLTKAAGWSTPSGLSAADLSMLQFDYPASLMNEAGLFIHENFGHGWSGINHYNFTVGTSQYEQDIKYLRANETAPYKNKGPGDYSTCAQENCLIDWYEYKYLNLMYEIQQAPIARDFSAGLMQRIFGVDLYYA